jgi:hypothetical protein
LLGAPILGISFRGLINLSNEPNYSFEPRISATGNNVYVVWNDNTEGDNDMYFARSTHNGTTFEDVINLSQEAEGISGLPQIAASDRDNVYVTWPDKGPGNPNIFFCKSNDRGNTFSDPVN